MQRPAQPEEIAPSIVFFASPIRVDHRSRRQPAVGRACAHVRERRARHVEITINVCLECTSQLHVVYVGQGLLVLLVGSAVDEDVEMAERGDGLVDGSLAE